MQLLALYIGLTEVIGLFVGLVVVFWFLGVTVALIILWSRANPKKFESQLSQLRGQLDTLHSRLKDLERAFSDLKLGSVPVESRDASKPVTPGVQPAVPGAVESKPEEARTIPPIVAVVPGAIGLPKPGPTAAPAVQAAASPHPQMTSAAPTRRTSPELEALIGGNWLLKIGIISIVLGALYFLKYAFDNQWIGDTGRVLIGIFSGLGFLYGGEYFQKKGYPLYGQTLAGGGISILYLSIYAAFNFYALITQFSALLFMALVTAVCGLSSVRYQSKTLAVLGLLGGMLTPIWLSTGKSNEIGLLSYLLILDLGAGLVALSQRWLFLNTLSLAGTVLLFSAWGFRFYSSEARWTTEVFLSLFAALYVFLAGRMHSALEEAKSANVHFPAQLTAVVLTLFFFSSQAILGQEAKYYWGFLVIFDALVLGACLRIKASWVVPSVFILNSLGIAQWISEHYRLEDRPITWGCLTLLFALFLSQALLRRKLAVAPADSWDVLLGFSTGLGYFALSYYLLADGYLGWMGLFAVGLALVYVVAARSVGGTAPGDKPVTLAFIGVSVTLVTLAIPIQLEHHWITLGWAAESVALTWIGFGTSSARLRLGALVVLLISLLRLFAFDAFQYLPEYTLIFNKRAFTFAAEVAAIYFVAMFYRRNHLQSEHWERPFYAVLILLASAVSVFLLSQESLEYHDDKVRQLSLSSRREELSAARYQLLSEQVFYSRQLVLSVIWGIYSIAAIVAGILRRYRPIRLFGICLFFVAIIKVFSMDIWMLQRLYRIISVISLGCLLLGVAFLYQRFKKLIFEA